MNASRIRGFLLQLPKPHSVRVSGDGEPQTLKPGRSYAKLADTIAALSPDLIELLDKDGAVVRATRLDSDESHRSEAAAVPEALKHDPHALMLTHFANLVHRAYEHSSEIAFTKLVELVDKMNDRADGIEQRLERAESRNRALLQDQVDAEFERAQEVAAASGAGGEGDLGQQLVGSFLSGAMNSTVGAKTVANGKG
jgi:hypothetical protein